MNYKKLIYFVLSLGALLFAQNIAVPTKIKTTSISVGSGGVSLGSYQGGYLYGKQLAKKDLIDKNKDTATVENYPILTGASAGAINTLGDLYHIFHGVSGTGYSPYKEWLDIDWELLTKDSKNIDTVSRLNLKPLLNPKTIDLILGGIIDSILNPPINTTINSTKVYLGFAVTRFLAPVIDSTLDVKGVDEKIVLGFQWLAQCPDPSKNSKGCYRMWSEYLNKNKDTYQPYFYFGDYGTDLNKIKENLKQIILASSAFPVAFSPIKMQHIYFFKTNDFRGHLQKCNDDLNYANCFLVEINKLDKKGRLFKDEKYGIWKASLEYASFSDGGMFENQPLNLALRICEDVLARDANKDNSESRKFSCAPMANDSHFYLDKYFISLYEKISAINKDSAYGNWTKFALEFDTAIFNRNSNSFRPNDTLSNLRNHLDSIASTIESKSDSLNDLVKANAYNLQFKNALSNDSLDQYIKKKNDHLTYKYLRDSLKFDDTLIRSLLDFSSLKSDTSFISKYLNLDSNVLILLKSSDSLVNVVCRDSSIVCRFDLGSVDEFKRLNLSNVKVKAVLSEDLIVRVNKLGNNESSLLDVITLLENFYADVVRLQKKKNDDVSKLKTKFSQDFEVLQRILKKRVDSAKVISIKEIEYTSPTKYRFDTKEHDQIQRGALAEWLIFLLNRQPDQTALELKKFIESPAYSPSILKVNHTSFPLASEHLMHFSGFFDERYREFDFSVGFLDALKDFDTVHCKKNEIMKKCLSDELLKQINNDQITSFLKILTDTGTYDSIYMLDTLKSSSYSSVQRIIDTHKKIILDLHNNEKNVLKQGQYDVLLGSLERLKQTFISRDEKGFDEEDGSDQAKNFQKGMNWAHECQNTLHGCGEDEDPKETLPHIKSLKDHVDLLYQRIIKLQEDDTLGLGNAFVYPFAIYHARQGLATVFGVKPITRSDYVAMDAINSGFRIGFGASWGWIQYEFGFDMPILKNEEFDPDFIPYVKSGFEMQIGNWVSFIPSYKVAPYVFDERVEPEYWQFISTDILFADIFNLNVDVPISNGLKFSDFNFAAGIRLGFNFNKLIEGVNNGSNKSRKIGNDK